MKFTGFNKIPRWSRNIIITEKIDGTNASIFIGQNGEFFTGSRKRWITPQDDNYGFSAWAHDNKEQLLQLGPGHHFGEWWGNGIQRNYNMATKRFSLFNTWKFTKNRPPCCDIVPILFAGILHEGVISDTLTQLSLCGSVVAPGFMEPEGIIIWHEEAHRYFKKTIKNDEGRKGQLVQK